MTVGVCLDNATELCSLFKLAPYDIKILFGTVAKVFKKQDIYEEKLDETLNDAEAAQLAEEEIIRVAHLPDLEEVTA